VGHVGDDRGKSANLGRVFTTSGLGVAFVDARNRLVDTNAAFDSMVERPHNELIGITLADLLDPVTRRRWRDAWRRVADEAEAVDVGTFVARPDGGRRPAVARLRRFDDGRGMVSLRMLDGTDAHLVLDGDHRVVLANEAAGALLGRSPDELTGRSYLDFLDPADQADARRELDEMITGTHHLVAGERGSGRWIRAALRSTSGAEGMDHVLRLEDTTRHHADDTWRRLVVEQSREGLFATDANGTLTFVNQAWEAITGIDRDAALGHPLAQLGGALGALTDALAEALDHGGRADVPLSGRDTEPTWVEVVVDQPIGPDGASGHVLDITDRGTDGDDG
jgi:PAS domain S-box-containing protein